MQDSAKEREVLSVTKDLDCPILVPKHGEAPPGAHSYGVPSSAPSRFPNQVGMGTPCPTVRSERLPGFERRQAASGVAPR